MKYDLLAMSGHKGKAAFEEIKNKDDICNTLNLPHYYLIIAVGRILIYGIKYPCTVV